MLIPTDNSPAQWAFFMAYTEEDISIHDILPMLEQGRIPISMIFKNADKASALYKGVLGNCPNTQSFGWTLAHIEKVGLGRCNLKECEPSMLEDHFSKFISPRNMFVIPKDQCSGLEAVPAFMKGFVREQNKACDD